jgi:hypothetical protein
MKLTCYKLQTITAKVCLHSTMHSLVLSTDVKFNIKSATYGQPNACAYDRVVFR